MIDPTERAAMEDVVRAAIADAVATGGADVDPVLAELGWLAMLDDAPGDAIAVVFRALGAANATATALDDLLAWALGERPRADLSVLLPPFATWAPPGRIEADDVAAYGLATGRAATAAEMVVVCGTALEPCRAIVPATATSTDAVLGIDPAARLRTVRVQGRARCTTRIDPAAWQSAVALGRRAVAHEIEGAGRAMLDLGRSHALERIQFGRPIARFQAVRHRLAESLVALEALEAALTAAREEPNADTAALAKAIAGRTAQAVARHCQQVLAGIGFTTDHPFHRFLKRTLQLEGLFGSADAIAVDVGRRLLSERRVPTLIEL